MEKNTGDEKKRGSHEESPRVSLTRGERYNLVERKEKKG